MLLLKTAPQDLPYSSTLLARVIFLYLLSGLVVLNGVIEPPMALARLVLSISIVLAFSYMVLSVLNFKARFVQTVTALVGTGIVFNLMAWPLVGQLNTDDLPEATAGLLSLIMLVLVGWEILVTAHIYRHALNMLLVRALILSIGLFFISMTVSQLLLPDA